MARTPKTDTRLLAWGAVGAIRDYRNGRTHKERMSALTNIEMHVETILKALTGRSTRISVINGKELDG